MKHSVETSSAHLNHAHKFWLVLLMGLLLLLTTCCNRRPDADANTAADHATITVWAHHGKPEEWKTIQEQVTRFNESQTNVTAKLVEIAEANYDTQVQSAAASKQLPDVLEFDGPHARELRVEGLSQAAGRFGRRDSRRTCFRPSSSKERMPGNSTPWARSIPDWVVRESPFARTGQRAHSHEHGQRVDD
jgi:hypothetical protein